MAMHVRTGAAALMSAAIAMGCSNGPARTPDGAGAVSAHALERAGTLSVSALDFNGWHDGNFHYLPTLTVTAPSAGRAVFVQRVDFTTEATGASRLLKGIRYEGARRVQPGGSVALVPDGRSDSAEIVSPLALASISAIVFFVDEAGQSGVVSASRTVQQVLHRGPAGAGRR
jgi:hypothetical protein